MFLKLTGPLEQRVDYATMMHVSLKTGEKDPDTFWFYVVLRKITGFINDFMSGMKDWNRIAGILVLIVMVSGRYPHP